MNYPSFSVLIFSYGVLLTAVLAIVKQRKDRITIRFFIFCMSVCGWGFLFPFWISQHYSEATSLMLVRISYVSVVLIPITWVHFVFELIGKREPIKFFYLVNYAIAFFFVTMCPTPLLCKGMHSILGYKYMPTPGPVHHLHMVAFFTLVPYGFYHLIQGWRVSAGLKREQIKYLFIGTSIGFIAGSTIYLPFYKIPFPLVLLPLMPLYPMLTGIAMIRFGLFDPEKIADAFQREKLAAIGTMTTSINHEIRNPLYIIRGFAESHLENLKQGLYASKDETIQRSSEILAKTVEQTQRAIDIVKRFALFAKQRTGQEAQFEEVKLGETFEGVLPLIQHELELDKIKLTKEIPEALPSIRADRRHVEEVLVNLLINACQAMKEGGKITVRAEQQNGTVQMEIQDTGPGIPPDQLRRIFEPFYTTKESGTGLGLYITKQLMERNRGKISVKSEMGQGTSFLLRFPLGV